MVSSSAMLHLTSKKIVLSDSVPPSLSPNMSLTKIDINLSGWMKLPFSSTTPILSPSPSIPIPNSALFSITALERSVIFSGLVGSGG